MPKLTFIKEIHSSEGLLDLFKLNKFLWPSHVLGVNVNYNEEGVKNVIEVITKEFATSDVEDAIETLINSYDDSHELAVRERVKQDIVIPRMQKGLEFMAIFGANNIVKNKPLPVLDKLLSDLQPLLMRLLVGGFEMAYVFFLTQYAPGDTMTESEYAEFKRRFELTIGIEAAAGIEAFLAAQAEAANEEA